MSPVTIRPKGFTDVAPKTTNLRYGCHLVQKEIMFRMVWLKAILCFKMITSVRSKSEHHKISLYIDDFLLYPTIGLNPLVKSQVTP